MSRILSRLVIGVCAAAALNLGGCAGEEGAGAGADDKPTVAYVTNGVDPFWDIAKVGALAAAEEFNVNCDIRMPANGIVDQKRMIEDLLVRGVDGIAISPIAPANQTQLINQACARTHVITQDSDAPQTNRLAYVGMDNYEAGRTCGKLVKEAMPEGGTVMIFIGRLGQLNARLRRQGVIDELLNRPPDDQRYDAPGAVLEGDKYTILGTVTDEFSRSKAMAHAEDAIARHPDLGCMVGLFAYNPPACVEAVRGAGKVGEIKIVAFDEADGTLQGIIDGAVYGTVVQNPYQYGYQSVRILAGLARGDESVLPEGGFQEIEARVIRKDNVEEFWSDLKKKLNGQTEEKSPV